MATTINISLPETLKTYIDAQTVAEDFATPDEYIRNLIEEDKRHKNLETHLLNALKDEANAVEIPDDILERGDIVGFLEDKAKQFG